jgi:hypothetical protein
VALEIFTSPFAGTLVFGLEGALAAVELLDDLLEPPHPAMATTTIGTMTTRDTLLNDPPLREPEGSPRDHTPGWAR